METCPHAEDDCEQLAMMHDANMCSGSNEVPDEGKYPMFIDPLRDECNNPPKYMPQPCELPSTEHLQPMGAVDTWAGRTAVWRPTAGLAGIRPVQERYSITRCSTSEWAQKNAATIEQKVQAVQRATDNAAHAKGNLDTFIAYRTQMQSESTEQLRNRAQAIGHLKDKLKTAIHALMDEISSMEEARLRLRKALQILCMPESIAKECIELRSKRPATELVGDEPEQALIKELALAAEIRRTLQQLLADTVNQQSNNRRARQRLEHDWSDKSQAYEMDNENFQLRSNSTNLMLRPGFVRQPSEQSSVSCWSSFTEEALVDAEQCRQSSIKLREILNTTLLQIARDLRTQADRVEQAFDARIKCLQQNIQRFEIELRDCLQKLSDTERRISMLQKAVRDFEPGTKLVQTRLHIRSFRPGYENCRDPPQQKLLDEHCYIQNGVSTMMNELAEAEQCKQQLMEARAQLERELLLKRRALWIDGDCCIRKRAHYPTAIALSGFVNF